MCGQQTALKANPAIAFQSHSTQLVPRQLPTSPLYGDNQGVVKKLSLSQDEALPSVERAPFSPGALVIVTLGNPRDKFWGKILTLAPQGLSISGIELASFDDLAAMVKDGEPFTPAVVFFPMHRIERLTRPARRSSAFAGPALSDENRPASLSCAGRKRRCKG